MNNPLSYLRVYTMKKQEICEELNRIKFGNISWPRDTVTNYLRFGSGNNGKEAKYYTLETLLYFLQNENLSHDKYVRCAIKDGVPFVQLSDRDDLLDYLHGRTVTCDSADEALSPPLSSTMVPNPPPKEIPLTKSKSNELERKQKTNFHAVHSSTSSGNLSSNTLNTETPKTNELPSLSIRNEGDDVASSFEFVHVNDEHDDESTDSADSDGEMNGNDNHNTTLIPQIVIIDGEGLENEVSVQPE